MEKGRRELILNGAVILASGVFAGSVTALAASDEKGPGKETQPAEDLMREHGALRRILLVYEEGVRRIHSKEELDPAVVARGAGIIRDFIEGYHEKLEEEYIFPKLRDSGLPQTLIAQHLAGRKLTREILSVSGKEGVKSGPGSSKLLDSIASFIRMYRPHAAREDTVAFPEFKKAAGRREYDELREVFEKRERDLFGKNGFERIISEIADMEKALGIYDLAKFTPEAPRGAASGG